MKTFILVIGPNQQHPVGMNDAIMIHDFFGKMHGIENCSLLINEKATIPNILRHLNSITEGIAPFDEAVLLVYFTGHVIPKVFNGVQDFILIPSDYDGYNPTLNGLRGSVLNQLLPRKPNCHNLIVMDCTYSEYIHAQQERSYNANPTAYILSSGINQYSHIMREKLNSIFAQAFIDTIKKGKQLCKSIKLSFIKNELAGLMQQLLIQQNIGLAQIPQFPFHGVKDFILFDNNQKVPSKSPKNISNDKTPLSSMISKLEKVKMNDNILFRFNLLKFKYSKIKDENRKGIYSHKHRKELEIIKAGLILIYNSI